MEIVPLDGGGGATVELCGGKGAALSALIGAGFNVPPAFCVTTNAFQATVERAGLGVLAPSDALTGFAHDTLLRCDLPAGVRGSVESAYLALVAGAPAARSAVSARSSAPAEDGAEASFAGQFESYLNIHDFAELELAIRRCWASVFAERVLAYRALHAVGFVPMAVVVQQMVPTDVFAVVFTRNPLRPADDELLINAAYGLGEPVVSGTVNPDTFRVARGGGTLEAAIGAKGTMAIQNQFGGIEVVATPRLLRQARTLTDPQLDELRRMALDVERWLGAPADIECGWHDGRWWLLQCRPITTLGAGRRLEQALPERA